ncbi:MAG: NAD(P)H-hydrate dehydratase, partial [Bacteroidota bacterium]
YTRIATPEGRIWFNTSGNAGLARGGSGDVLTGMILSFLSQGYVPEDAALLAVYFHGKAADIAVSGKSMQAMSLDDLLHALPEVFLPFEK